MRSVVTSVLVLTWLVSLAMGQAPAVGPGSTAVPQTSPAPVTGVITGVVTGDNGQPLSDAVVSLRAVSSTGIPAADQTTITEADGTFRFENLRGQTYTVTVSKVGYVMPDTPDPTMGAPRYRIGASLVLNLLKGGIITGTVTDADGLPMIAAPLRFTRVREANGRKPQYALQSGTARTDDRGIYRIYGLPAGSYLVSVGAVDGRNTLYAGIDEANDSIPVYYPSSPADSAEEVLVGYGQEVSGIDIRGRSQAGHTISGIITGDVRGNDVRAPAISVTLYRTANGMVMGSASAIERNGEFPFSLQNVPDGEYDLKADRWQRDGGAASVAKHVTVKGNDIRGLQLNLATLGSISGRLIVETDPTLKNLPSCAAAARPGMPEEFSFRSRRQGSTRSDEFENLFYSREAAADADGKFSLSGMRGGTYWFQFSFPDERQYLRSIAKTDPAGKSVDLGRTGLKLGEGERLSGLAINLRDGAASLQGRIVPSTPGGRLTGRVFLHLIPSESESTDDILRFREVEAGSDGSFALTNIAPGNYWVYAESRPTSDIREYFRQPMAWDTAARLKLRRAAEATNLVIELKPCQRLTDYLFRFTPVPAK